MHLLRILALASVAAVTCRADSLDSFFHHDVLVVTNTEITEDGRKVPPPSEQQPVYYIAINLGYRDFGAGMTGDKKPMPPEMIKILTKALAKQGFRPATNKHPPTQVIAYAWGTFYTIGVPSGSSPDTSGPLMTPGPDLPDQQFNIDQKLRFMGGGKLGFGASPYAALGVTSGVTDSGILTPNQESLISTAEEDLYMAALTGYDYSSFAAGKAKALWRTRISCPSRGLVMDQTLKTMIVMATPFIGRETAQPVWTNASDKYVPNIKLGDPKLEEFIDEGKMPTVDQSEATGKTSK